MPWETTKGPGNRIGGRLAGLFVSAEYTEAAMLEEEWHSQRVAKFSPKLGKNTQPPQTVKRPMMSMNAVDVSLWLSRSLSFDKRKDENNGRSLSLEAGTNCFR